MTESRGVPPLTLSSQVIASSGQVSSDLAGETVLLSMKTAKYYGFEGVGSRIWALAQSPIAVADICTTIALEYEVEPERAESDTLAFLSQLLDKGLLEVRSGA